MTYSAFRAARRRLAATLRTFDGRRWYAYYGQHGWVEMVGIPDTTPTLSH